MKRYCLRIQYKGTHYHGWQTQPNAITVQQKVDEAISIFTRENIESIGCGRTDTGVHASMFYLHFDTTNEIIDLSRALKSIGFLLPHDISAHELFEVSQDFHARFDAISRTYNYFIHFEKNPFIKEFSYKIHHTLNYDLMNQAAAYLLEVNDFSCFSKSNTQTLTNICNVSKAFFIKIDDSRWMFEITADRFLRNMVRAIVGTLIMVGESKINLSEFKQIIQSKNRNKAGSSVDAAGLFLVNVVYDFDKFKVKR